MGREFLAAPRRTLIRAGLACAVLAWSAVAFAADPSRGARLFATSPKPGVLPCMDCHSENPQVNNFGFIWTGRNAVSLIHRAVQSNTGGMGVFLNLYSYEDLADIAAYLGIAPAALTFASTEIGATSAPQRVTISASIKQGLSALKWTISGDFLPVATTCGPSLAPFEACTIDVAFRPSQAGLRQGTLSIDHADTPTPVRLALSGEGAPGARAVAALRPAVVSFPGGPGTRRTAVLANASDVALRVQSLRSTHAGVAIVGGSCMPGLALGPGESCRVALRLEVSGDLAAPAALEVVHDGEGGVSRVDLVAQGAVSPGVAGPGGPAFGLQFGFHAPGTRSPAQLLAVHGGSTGLDWRFLEVTDAAFQVEASDCPLSQALERGRACQFSVDFGSVRPGHYSGELRLRSAEGRIVWRAPLEGSVGLPGLRLARDRLQWQGVVSRTQAQDLVVLNQSGEDARLPAVSIVGLHAGDFQVAADSPCRPGAALPPWGSCVLRLAFTPQAAGTRTATLQLGPLNAPMTGRATPESVPLVSVDRSRIDFAWRPPGAVSAGQTLTLTHRGSVPLAWRGVALTGDARGSFGLEGSCEVGRPVPPGGQCQLEVRHRPMGAGHQQATLVLWPEGASEPLVVALAGEGRDAPGASLQPDRLAVDFGAAPLGAPEPVRRVSVRNTGGVTMAAPTWTVTGPFGLGSAGGRCPASLAPGQACAVDVAFSTRTLGAFTGLLSLQADGASPIAVPLQGRVEPSGPLLAWASSAAVPVFEPTAVGAVSPSLEWRVTNRGGAPSEPLAWRVDGDQAQDFSVISEDSCAWGAVLAPGASCRIQLRFHPSASGPRQARFQWLGAAVPDALSLQGTGQGLGLSQLRASPGRLTFQARSGAEPMPQPLTLWQDGATLASLQAAAIGSPAFASIVDPASACAGEEPSPLPGEGCRFELSWDGSAAGRLSSAWFLGTRDGQDLVTVPVGVAEDPAQRSNVGAGGVSWGWLLGLGVALVLLRRDRQESGHA